MKRIPCRVIAQGGHAEDTRGCRAVISARLFEDFLEEYWDHVMYGREHFMLSKRLLTLSHSKHKKWQERMARIWRRAPEEGSLPVEVELSVAHRPGSARRGRPIIPRVSSR